MGYKLVDADEYTHTPGTQENWNESRYIDFWDPAQRVGGWFRIGNRPNAQYAEMSASINLPDGRTAFMFNRPKITTNGMKSGDQSWEVVSPWDVTKVSYHGDVMILDDAWSLTDPKTTFKTAPRVPAKIDLVTHAYGLKSIMGQDQDHIDLIFLPGQADFHYQHLIRTEGTVKIGDQSWNVAGRGGKDHSWGPRNWHAKIYLRWLICNIDDKNGFILQRAVGPTKKCRSGHVLDNGQFYVVDDFEMKNHFGPAPNYALEKTELVIKSGDKRWTATGVPRSWLPLRHMQKNEKGEMALLRIVKSPTDWTVSGWPVNSKLKGAGMAEIHDLMVDGKPYGLDD